MEVDRNEPSDSPHLAAALPPLDADLIQQPTDGNVKFLVRLVLALLNRGADFSDAIGSYVRHLTHPADHVGFS